MWAKVCQLTRRFENRIAANPELDITASALNKHDANLSTDASYKALGLKLTTSSVNDSSLIAEWQIFQAFNGLKLTAAGLDNKLAWFLKIGALRFAAPKADVINLSLSMCFAPKEWKVAYILPVSNFPVPQSPVKSTLF